MRYVALTFDDGTIKQYHAIKVLSKFNVKCTIFCITHLRKHPDTNKQLLASEPEKIQELHSLGHEIGSHTCTHPSLIDVSPENLVFELKVSKEKLESIVGSEIMGFAYPYSLLNSKVKEEVKKYYSYARSGLYKLQMWNKETDLYRIPSFGFKRALTLPFSQIEIKHRKEPIIAVIMLHNIQRYLLLFLIRYLRFSLRAKFVTMSEAINIFRSYDAF
ncbi:MAG: polysaccharide deacetylase family protein [Candidatus Baldrarchaeia archaeon]